MFDGRRVYLVRLTRCDRGGVRGEAMEARSPQPLDPVITLAFGCVRPGPFQEILRHGTELGVSRFVPILSSRTSRRPEGEKPRWRAVVESASAQSGRAELPKVESPMSLEAFVHQVTDVTAKFVLSTVTSAPDFFSALCAEGRSPLVLLVGPEGGFERSEEEQAVNAGFRPVRLGPGVLRTETAAMAAVALTVSWWEWVKAGRQRSSDVPSGRLVDPE